MTTIELLQKTKAAWPALSAAPAEEKNRLLLAMADALESHIPAILAANGRDMAGAEGHISAVMLDRLRLDEGRVRAMADGVRAAAALPDHTGRILAQFTRPNGMTITKVQVPLGLVAIIYESRPNVTSDAAALAIKSGNVCMLRSGREAYRSCRAVVDALKDGITAAGGDPDIVNIVEDTSRQSANDIMQARGLVDLLIPRGGAGLIRACVENAAVPCIETGTGICHVYVDAAADLEKAVRIITNAKTSRPSVCNAEEVCLVHAAAAARFLPMLRRALVDDRVAAGLPPVELRLDPRAAAVIDGTPASDTDFDTEFLDYILAVAVVDSLDVVILGATEIDTDFNVNVHTDSRGAIMGGSGGHSDTAAGAKLSMIIAPLFRARLPIVTERVRCISTPGRDVDVLVTQRGVAVNPRRAELAERLKAAGLPIVDIHELKEIAERITGAPAPVSSGDQVVARVIHRDGNVIDAIHNVI